MGRTQSALSPDTGVSNLALLRTAATAHAKFVLVVVYYSRTYVKAVRGGGE